MNDDSDSDAALEGDDTSSCVSWSAIEPSAGFVTCNSDSVFRKSNSVELPSYDTGSSATRRSETHGEGATPVIAPNWMSDLQSIAHCQDSWLYQGRRTTDGTIFAMKVIDLPLNVVDSFGGRILLACKEAGGVQNPHWVSPECSIIHGRSLAVVRRWVHGNDWRLHLESPREQLQKLALVAFALQSAHNHGTSHGAVHDANLIVDHSGRLLLLDAVTNSGIQKWLSAEGLAPFESRQKIDVKQLLILVAISCLNLAPKLGERVLRECRWSVQTQPLCSCETIGELLMECSDAVDCRFGEAETYIRSSSKRNTTNSIHSWFADLWSRLVPSGRK